MIRLQFSHFEDRAVNGRPAFIDREEGGSALSVPLAAKHSCLVECFGA